MQGYEFREEDIPLVLDATFAIAVHAYSLALHACTLAVGEKGMPDNFGVQDVLMDRFMSQGFDIERSSRVSEIISKTIHKMLMDAKRDL